MAARASRAPPPAIPLKSAMRIIAIDFEASCLPRHGQSFPIEVGISEDGRTARSWLIRPTPSWREWDWTTEAERLHGLSRTHLERDGLPARDVAQALAAAVGDAYLVSDSPIDHDWLRTLCEAAGMPIFTHVHTVGELFDARGLASGPILDAVARVEGLGLRRHRAGDDARWLAAVLAELGVVTPAEPPLFAWGQSAPAEAPATALAA